MFNPQPRPQLNRVKRKFGGYDFQRFDHLPLLHTSLGGGTIGKVKVDCRFHVEKSQWGVLGPKRDPAGIIYMDLDFDQPVDCRLKSATVAITIDDRESKALFNTSLHTPRAYYDCPVEMTHWFGPKHLSRDPVYVRKTKRSMWTPTLEVLGMAGIGGVGRESDEEYLQENCWNFSGRITSSNRHILTYNTIKWELTENALESVHSNVIHTAFSFRHGGGPFLMEIVVSGKLQSTSDRVKHRLKQFPSRMTKENAGTKILVNFDGHHIFSKPLDEHVEGLEHAMNQENIAEASKLVENRLNGYRPVSKDPLADVKPEEANWGSDTTLMDSSPSALPPSSERRGIEGPEIDPMTIAAAVMAIPSAKPGHSVSLGSSASDTRVEEVSDASETYLDTEDDRDTKELHHGSKRGSLHIQPSSRSAQVDSEAIITLLQIPGFLPVIQAILTFLALFGMKVAAKERTIDKERDDDTEAEERFDRSRRTRRKSNYKVKVR